jgi:hypothetical protein
MDEPEVKSYDELDADLKGYQEQQQQVRRVGTRGRALAPGAWRRARARRRLEEAGRRVAASRAAVAAVDARGARRAAWA